MKKFLLSAFAAILIMSGCTCHIYQDPDPYSYMQGPNGQQVVVVRDNSGSQFVMDYLLFNSLMNSGGYNSVVNYYHVHPTIGRPYNRSYYSSWKPYRGTYSGYSSGNHSSSSYSGSRSQFRNTSPASPKTSVFRNTSPVSKPSTSFRSTSPSSSGFSSTGSSYRSSSSSYRSSSFRSTGRH